MHVHRIVEYYVPLDFTRFVDTALIYFHLVQFLSASLYVSKRGAY